MDVKWMLLGTPFLELSHVIFLGFITLIATPVIRIAAPVIMFHRARDRASAVITA